MFTKAPIDVASRPIVGNIDFENQGVGCVATAESESAELGTPRSGPRPRSRKSSASEVTVGPQNESLVRSKQRVADHGEVFTPSWLVDEMLDLVGPESERIDARFLEPACGAGNFLKRVLSRKLQSAQRRYGSSAFEYSNFALLGLMSIYGIELLEDNVEDCRANMLEIFCETMSLGESDALSLAARRVLELNIVHGNALTMQTDAGEPILFAEWGYLGRGRFQRRDFLFENLTMSSYFNEEGSLFANLGKHELFSPVKSYAVMTVGEIGNDKQS